MESEHEMSPGRPCLNTWSSDAGTVCKVVKPLGSGVWEGVAGGCRSLRPGLEA